MFKYMKFLLKKYVITTVINVLSYYQKQNTSDTYCFTVYQRLKSVICNK